jgi:hypothetical protein
MDFNYADATVGFRRRVFAIPQFALDFDVRTSLQRAGPLR